VGVRRFWECGVRSLFWGCWGAIAFGMWGCDRFWGVGMRSLFEDFGSAIAFGVWG